MLEKNEFELAKYKNNMPEVLMKMAILKYWNWFVNIVGVYKKHKWVKMPRNEPKCLFWKKQLIPLGQRLKISHCCVVGYNWFI